MKPSFGRVVSKLNTLSNVFKSNQILCTTRAFSFVNQNSAVHSSSYLVSNVTFNSKYCKCLLNRPERFQHSILNSFSISARCFAAPTECPNEPPKKDEPKPSLYQRFKSMYRDYWYVLLPVHVVTSIGWFGGFYYVATSGFDIVSMLEAWNVSEKVINPLRNGKAGYLAISYALYKIATPVRYTVTLGGATVSINYLKKWGYIKPVPSKKILKEMYEDKKGILKERGQTLKSNMIQSLKPNECKNKKKSS